MGSVFGQAFWLVVVVTIAQQNPTRWRAIATATSVLRSPDAGDDEKSRAEPPHQL
jgi:hypothetical protein